MPGGLAGVEQVFTADASGYVAEIQAMIKANQGLVQSVAEAKRAVGDAGRAPGGGGAADGIAKTNAAIRDQLKTLGDYSRVVRDVATATTEMGRVHTQVTGTVGGHADAVGTLGASYEAARTRINAMAADALRANADMAAGFERQIDLAGRTASQYDASREKVRGLTSEVSGLRTEIEKTATAATAQGESLVQFWRRASPGGGGGGFTPVGGGGGGGGGPVFPVGGGGGGDDSWRLRALAASSGPFDKGTAGAMWAPVGTFLSTWLPRAHYVLMAANELAATLGPATVAAGMGALVGMQGGEQAIPRLRAVFNTAESLGGSLGTTAGQYMGLKTPQLQNAQDLATGAAFEAVGAVTNIMRAGGGSPFIQLGSNTDAMWARMMANLTQEFQQGLGKQLGGVVAGGTDYLAQFGHVFGNLGHLFLNVAPNLPGVGGDYLSILQGATGGLAKGTGFMGGMMGPILAMEAGGRLGAPLVGGAGALLGRAGAGLGGLADSLGATSLSGLSAADIAAVAGETGVGLTAGGGLLSRVLGRSGVGLAKAGGALGSLTAADIGGIAAVAFTAAKGYTYQTPGQQQASAMLAGVNQQGIVQGIPSIISSMQKLSGVAPGGTPEGGQPQAIAAQANVLRDLTHGNMSGVWQQTTRMFHGILGTFGVTGQSPTNFQAAQAALQQLSETMVNSLGTGRQVQQQWKGLGGGAVDMGKAFDIATMAQLQLGSAFEKNGKLTAQAKTMIANLYAGYQPMNMNAGQFGAAVGAQTAMSGLQHTQVSAVNTAYDQLTQLVSGGPSGAAALSGLIARMPTGSGTAMKGFLSPKASTAWTAFASTTSPSVISQLQQQTDYLREAQTMGALSAGQSKSMTEFLLGQALPSAKGSPSALAMLSMIGQQAGGPAFAPGTSAAQMYKQLSAFAKQGGGAGGFTAGMTQSTEAMANIGRDAQQFVQQIGSGIGGALAQGIATHGATLQDAFMNSVGGKGGFSGAALSKYTQFLAGSGVPLKGAQDMVSYAAKLSGAGPQQIQKMLGQLNKEYNVYVKVHADTAALAKIRSDINAIKDKQVHAKVNVEGASAVKTLQNQIDALKSKSVEAAAHAQGAAAVAALNAEINALHSKQVTITTRMITIGGMAGVTPGIPAGVRAPGMQTGGMVPGSGSGDIIPAMLEPGEAIIPRYLVPLISPILAAHRVPGFGGMPQSSSSHFAAGGLVPHPLGFPDPATLQGDAGKFAFTLIDGITKALNNAGAKKIADALVAQIGKEVALAKNVSSAAMSGQGFGNAGLLGGFDVTPGTGNGTVQEQMQSYLGSVKSFTKDIATLRKDHLNKAVISQLIGAGPVQGDALAQSILGGYGGVKSVNSLWSQLGGATKGLGAQAAMAQFGGHLSPDLKSGSVSIGGINININASGGTTLALTTAQINQITAKVQAALLKQAKRNNKTGVQLPGKGA